jgi:hypothetical protein
MSSLERRAKFFGVGGYDAIIGIRAEDERGRVCYSLFDIVQR